MRGLNTASNSLVSAQSGADVNDYASGNSGHPVLPAAAISD